MFSRDVFECDGWVCVLEVIDTPSILSVIRKDTVLVRVLPTFAFRVTKNTVRRKWNSPLVDSGSWTPEDEKKRSVSRWVCRNNSLMNSLCNLPDRARRTINIRQRLLIIVVYYESRKWELQKWLMNEGRCNERLKARVEESTCLTYTGLHNVLSGMPTLLYTPFGLQWLVYLHLNKKKAKTEGKKCHTKTMWSL
jgi:hypothetical protein